MTAILVIAESTTSQRGLASLLTEESGFRVSETLDWTATPSRDYEAILGELDKGTEPLYLTEPFVLLCSEISLEPGPGRAILHPDSNDQTVLAALTAVLLGLSVTDEYHCLGSSLTPRTHDLTPREVEILSLLGDGLTNRQIGESLHISENTVKFHLGSIFSKLSVTSRAEAVTVGLRSGIILL